MFSRLRKKTKKKTKKDSPSPQGARKHISLPLVDTATQVDYSPKILNPKNSLLSYSAVTGPSYSVATAPSPDKSDGEEGYSTVREGPFIVLPEGRKKYNEDEHHFRSLPPIPSEQDESTQRKSSSATGDKSGSSLASVTPNEDHHEGRSSQNGTRNEDDSNNTDALRSMYAKVNKSGKLKNGSQQLSKDKKTVRTEEPNRTDRGGTAVHVSSEIFDISDSNDSYDDSLVFEESFLNEDSEHHHHHRVPPPQSSPVIVHRPPPSPSPILSAGGRHKVGAKDTTTSKSASSNKPQKTETKKSSSDSKHQKKKRPLSPDNAQQRATVLNISDVAGSSLPVYNLNQSLLVGGYYLARTTDSEGRVEYVHVSPLPPQESHTLHVHQGGSGGYGWLPVGSSTPLKHLPSSNVPISYQLQPPPSIPQHNVPGLSQDAPLLHSSFEQQSSIPLLPQPSIHSSTNPSNLSTFLQPASTSDHFASPQQQSSLHSKLSASQPASLNASGYVAGLTEIDQLLTEHQIRTVSANSNNGVYGGTKAKVTFQRTEFDGNTSSHSDKNSDDLLKKKVLSLTDENIPLKQTIHHPSQQQESVDNGRLSPQKLITETPVKLKRILDKLLTDNADKDREIQQLKSKLSDLSIKSAQLNESYKEQLNTSDANRQTLRDSLIQMKEDNEQLKEKLSVASRSLNSANKEHEERVYKLKQEVEELKNEVSRFQSNIYTTGHQYTDLQGILDACSGHTHSSLEDHKRTMDGLERLLHQVMHKSNALSNQQMVETAKVKQLNDVLSADLAEVKGKLSVLNEECKKLRKQKTEYEGIVSSLTRDLKFSQAREMQAVKSLNDSLRESDIEKMKLRAEPLLSQRQLQLEDMMKKMDEHRLTMKLERQKKLDKLLHQNHGQQKKTKESKTVSELKSELARKEQLLDEVYRDKRIAEKQRDILWESKLKNSH